MVYSKTGKGYVPNLVTALRARKFTQNLYLCFPSRVLLGTMRTGSDDGDELSLIIPFAGIFSTCAFIFPNNAKVVLYCGHLMGVESSSIISCSTSSLVLKSFESSS